MDWNALIDQIGLPLIAIVVPIIVAGIKHIWDTMPKWLMPITAAALGPALDQLIAFLPTIDHNGILALLAGLAGVGIREIKDQIGKTLN